MKQSQGIIFSKILNFIKLSAFFTAILVILLSSFSRPAFADDTDDQKKALFSIIAALSDINSGEPATEVNAINFLGQYGFREVLDQIKLRVEFELGKTMKAGENNINLSLLHIGLMAIGNMAVDTDVVDIERLEGFAENLKPLLAQSKDDHIRSLWTQLENDFAAVKNVAAKRDTELKSLREIVESKLGPAAAEKLDELVNANVTQMNPDQAPGYIPVQVTDYKVDLSRVKSVREYMESRVKGQPEVIDTFSALELRNHVYAGQRVAPEPIFLMGLPGTGKDTAVESYVDGIHGKKGAFLEHMMRLPILRSKADLWAIIGSATGYVGSDQGLSPFIRWLVKHSGGRYIIIEPKEKGDHTYIIENEEWKPGMVFEGYYAPEDAVLFANEFHNWSKDIKDMFLKQALEKGYFQINNPGKGISELYVPVTIVFATNEGTGLVASREANGERFGKPLTFDQMIERWQAAHKDIARLRTELARTAGAANTRTGSKEDQLGTSEEFINRIPNRAFCLMRPVSPDDLKAIAQVKLEDLREKLKDSKAGYNIDLDWDEALPGFIQSYQYLAEDNARPLSDRIANMIEDTIFDAIQKQLIQPSTGPQKIKVKAVPNENKSYDLEFSGSVNFKVPIKVTLNDIPPAPISSEEIQKLQTLENRLKAQVFGVDGVAKAVAQSVLITQEGRNGALNEATASLPARVFMFLGPSSTGKTEMAKAMAREIFGSEDAMKTINFGQIQNIHDLEVKILGLRDSSGNYIPSDFMKEYDRANGRLLINADELANCPREVLKALYDILREPVVRTFSDNKPRVMSNVMIVMTGNAGEEWYTKIPRDAPREEQQAAMEEVYRQAMKDPDFRRQFLEKYFSEAFLNRIGEKNIFFFGPLNFKAIRQLTLFKLGKVLDMLKPQTSQRGWDVRFLNQAEYEKAIDTFETEGFVLREQGASIDRFLKQDFYESVRATLLRAEIPSGTKVAIYEMSRTSTNYRQETNGEVTYGILVDGKQIPLTFSIKRLEQAEQAKINQEDQIFTGFHEAGHELMRRALFPDKYRTDKITIVPGVANINNEWIRYLGVVSYQNTEHVEMTREAVVREIAVKEAGYVAQMLVSKGARHDAGKWNDMERGTLMAKAAVLRWGLSPAFGKESAPENMSLEDYAASLSDARKELFEQEYNKLLTEGQDLARSILLANFDKVFVPLALELIERGTLYREDLDAFYEQHKADIYTEADGTFATRVKNFSFGTFMATVSPYLYQVFGRDAELLPGVPRPTSVADVAKIIADKKQKQIAEIETNVAIPAWPETSPFAQMRAKLEQGADVIPLKPEQGPVKQTGSLSCADLYN